VAIKVLRAHLISDPQSLVRCMMLLLPALGVFDMSFLLRKVLLGPLSAADCRRSGTFDEASLGNEGLWDNVDRFQDS